MNAVGVWVGVAVIAAAIGAASAAGIYWAAGGVAALLVLVGIRAVAGTGPPGERDPMDARHIRVLAATWMAFMFVNNHRFTSGYVNGLAVRAPFQILIDLAVNVGVIAVGVWILSARRGAFADGRLANALIAMCVFPVWVLASMAWGTEIGTPILRFGQLGMTAMLATATLAVVKDSRPALDEFVSILLRWYAWTILALVVAGYTIGPVFANASGGNAARFTWPAAHPGVTGLFLGPAIIVLLAAPPSVLRMPLFIRVPAIALEAVALYQNHARTAVLGTLLAGLVVLWLAGRRQPIWRILGLPYVIGAAALVLIYAFRDVVEFALRGGTVANLTSLQGRTQLWGIAADELGNVWQWLVGLGAGASGRVFLDEVQFAGNAHNSALALIVNVGVIGLVMVTLLLVWASVGIVRTTLHRAPGLGIPLTGMMITLVMQAVTSDALAAPNFGFAFMYVLILVVLAERYQTWLGEEEPAPSSVQVA